MVTRYSGGTPSASPSMSEADQLLTSVEQQLRSLDRTSDAAPIIEELKQLLTEIRETLKSVSR